MRAPTRLESLELGVLPWLEGPRVGNRGALIARIGLGDLFYCNHTTVDGQNPALPIRRNIP